MTVPVVMSWSGGKDSALALNSLLADDEYEIVALLTTLTRKYKRIAMHGVRHELLLHQAKSIGIPLIEAWIPTGASNNQYEAVMADQMDQLRSQGVSTVAFGDLFLRDIRSYREQFVGRLDMIPLFPVWG